MSNTLILPCVSNHGLKLLVDPVYQKLSFSLQIKMLIAYNIVFSEKSIHKVLYSTMIGPLKVVY